MTKAITWHETTKGHVGSVNGVKRYFIKKSPNGFYLYYGEATGAQEFTGRLLDEAKTVNDCKKTAYIEEM